MASVLSDGLKKVLDSKVFATVATVQPDGSPQLSVVWVIRDGDDVLFSTTADRRKGRNLVRDPRITVLVTAQDDPYAYAEIRGTATISEEGGVDLINTISRKYTGKDYAEFNPASDQDGERVIVRVTPRKVVGSL